MYIGGMTVLNNLIVDGSLEELAVQTANTIKATGPASGSATAPSIPGNGSGRFACFNQRNILRVRHVDECLDLESDEQYH